MAAAEDLAAFFDTENGDAELVTVQGVDVAALFDISTQLVLEEALVTAPTVLLPASVAAAEGGAVHAGGVDYVIRQVIKLPPDGALHRLVLAEA
jgi:hypothetical protein